MYKKLLFLLVLIVLLAVAVLVTVLFLQNGAKDDVATNDFTNLPTEAKPLVAVPKLDTSTYEHVADDIYLARSKTNRDKTFYEIYYYANENKIGVSLLSEPISIARELAEEDLIDMLRLSKESLCNQEISVTTPRFASPEFAGRELGLSFCPGSVQLE